MESLGLIVGHLLGDFCVQNDWMAKNKTNPSAGSRPVEKVQYGRHAFGFEARITPIESADSDAWIERRIQQRIGDLACLVHCILYTLSVWICSFWWMPVWGLAIVFLAHYPIDRWRLAYLWMQYSGLKHFSSKDHPMFPWSIVVVDNTFHLLTLFVIGLTEFVS